MQGHTEKPVPIILTAEQIRNASNSLSQFRGYAYDDLKPTAKTALDMVIGKLSVCKDTHALFAAEAEQRDFVTKQFVSLGHGYVAKDMALDMIGGFVDSICKQTGAKRPKPGPAG